MKSPTKIVLILLCSILLTACGSMMPNPFTSTVNDSKVEGVSEAKTIKTKDIYGAWAITSDKGDPDDMLFLMVFLPNHSGLNFFSLENTQKKTEYELFDYYTWKFNEKTKILNSNSYKRQIVDNGKVTIEEWPDLGEYEIRMYQIGSETAIRLIGDDGRATLLKMDDETYQNLVKDTPGIPPLKR